MKPGLQPARIAGRAPLAGTRRGDRPRPQSRSGPFLCDIGAVNWRRSYLIAKPRGPTGGTYRRPGTALRTSRLGGMLAVMQRYWSPAVLVPNPHLPRMASMEFPGVTMRGLPVARFTPTPKGAPGHAPQHEARDEVLPDRRVCGATLGLIALATSAAPSGSPNLRITPDIRGERPLASMMLGSLRASDITFHSWQRGSDTRHFTRWHPTMHTQPMRWLTVGMSRSKIG